MRSIAQNKSMEFSIRIVNLYRYLNETKKERVLSKQILRSGTSIGANLFEAECANSKSDFLFKNTISLKETNETLYWLELLYKTDYISETQYQSLYRDCVEIKKLISSTTKTIKENCE